MEGSVQELTDGGDGEGATGGADAPMPPTEHAQAQEEESQDDSHPGKALFHVVFGWELKRSGHAWPFPRAGAVLFCDLKRECVKNKKKIKCDGAIKNT